MESRRLATSCSLLGTRKTHELNIIEGRMIKKQYYRYPNVNIKSYFNNFLRDFDPNSTLHDELKKYNATIAKSKQPNSMFNIKWHDHKMYTLFVLRWS